MVFVFWGKMVEKFRTAHCLPCGLGSVQAVIVPQAERIGTIFRADVLLGQHNGCQMLVLVDVDWGEGYTEGKCSE